VATGNKSILYIGAGTKNYYQKFIVSPDPKLGIGLNGRGLNQLGELYTQLRDELALEATKTTAIA